jgi:hypothetical protein
MFWCLLGVLAAVTVFGTHPGTVWRAAVVACWAGAYATWMAACKVRNGR